MISILLEKEKEQEHRSFELAVVVVATVSLAQALLRTVLPSLTQLSLCSLLLCSVLSVDRCREGKTAAYSCGGYRGEEGNSTATVDDDGG